MCSSSVLTVSLCLLLCVPLCLSSEDPQEVKVKPGENATLQCRSSREAEVVLIQWIRPDLKSEGFIFIYTDGHLQEESLHPSYLGRVELKDPEMKDGNVSVILKNVTFNDPGTYECFVGNKGSKPELISSIYLRVQHSVNITAAPGQNVSLPCRAPSNTDITVVEWTRPGLGSDYVLMYKDGRSVPENQLPSFKNRVELEDRQMKDGDVSMILKDVTSKDTGTYECRVFHTETDSSSRSEPISIVHLEVQSGDTGERRDEEGGDKKGGDKDGGDKDGGDKGGGDKDGGDKEGGDKRLQIGLGVGLPALFVVVVGGGVAAFIIYRKRRKPTEQSSHKAAYRAARTEPADPPDP